MDAKELRIGNYIQDDKSRILEVDGVKKDDTIGFEIEAWPINGGGIVSLPLKPIPLTEEWLIDFGFELITDKDKGFRRTLFHMRKPCWTLCKLDIGFGVEFWQGNQLKYVHQLQNLYFALTGEELKIKTTSSTSQ